MSDSAASITGRIVLVAEIEARPDKIAEVEKALLAVKAHANSDAEPGCLTFRVAKYGAKFVAFEEYQDAAALVPHAASGPSKALASALPDLIASPPKISFYEESKL